MDLPPRLILSLAEIRLTMRVALTVMPRHIFRELWQPNRMMKEGYRDEVVARLTAGWETWEITRPATEDDFGRVAYDEEVSRENQGE